MRQLHESLRISCWKNIIGLPKEMLFLARLIFVNGPVCIVISSQLSGSNRSRDFPTKAGVNVCPSCGVANCVACLVAFFFANMRRSLVTVCLLGLRGFWTDAGLGWLARLRSHLPRQHGQHPLCSVRLCTARGLLGAAGVIGELVFWQESIFVARRAGHCCQAPELLGEAGYSCALGALCDHNETLEDNVFSQLRMKMPSSQCSILGWRF